MINTTATNSALVAQTLTADIKTQSIVEQMIQPFLQSNALLGLVAPLRANVEMGAGIALYRLIGRILTTPYDGNNTVITDPESFVVAIPVDQRRAANISLRRQDLAQYNQTNADRKSIAAAFVGQ